MALPVSLVYNYTLVNFKLYTVSTCALASKFVLLRCKQKCHDIIRTGNSNIVRQVEKCFNASGILLLNLQRIPIVSVFTHLFTYTCCKEFQFGNEFDSYETKWQLHCCLMCWHFLNREFIKSKLGRSSNKKSKLGKSSINVKRCGFIDIRWTAIFLIDFVEINYPLK